MTSGPPMLDLVVVGGMTVDRFADGSSAPGGTVMHAARAAVPRGARVGIVTASGDEPEAREGLNELRRLAAAVEHRPHGHSATFQHRDSARGRRLWLERAGGPVGVDLPTPNRIRGRAILFAPVMGEVPTSALTEWDDASRRGAILQGWLRSADEGAAVQPLPLRALAASTVEALALLDLLVASREDLLAESGAPVDQLAALRGVFGTTPALVVTDGAEGIWLDAQPAGLHQGRVRHLGVPRRVDAASTIGAGDVLAAFMTMPGTNPAQTLDLRAEDAMRVVAEVLEARRG